MNAPIALAYDPVNARLFVADAGNNRVLVFSTSSLSDGPNATNIIGQTSFTTNATGGSATTLDLPTGVAYDPNTSPLRCKLRRFDCSSEPQARPGLDAEGV